MLMSRETHITGKALAECRKSAGYTQTDLADLIGCGRHAVSYWETKPELSLRWGVPNRIAVQLGIPIPQPIPRAGVAAWERICCINAPIHARANHGVLVQRCGAKTRAGHPCKRRPEPERKRCRNHGGLSTGPKTQEGRLRIAAVQRRRWQVWRYDQCKSNCSKVLEAL